MDNKYTEFIENYLINDKTKSAIMLIGGWGTGKSFYIQNVLKPYLEEKQKDCIIVSLYGLNDLKEISKAIYLEEKVKKISAKISELKPLNNAEKQAKTKLVGKTIVKGIASFFNIDLTSSEDDLQNLYESLDLSGKLIIFEDLERTNIPIKDVLGYVNNLVEQDGVKVLLVANEKEILKSTQVVVGKDKEGKDVKEWRWTAETQEYLKTKEKTVSDTIPYVCNYFETIENILNLFEDKKIEELLVDKFDDLETEGITIAPKTKEKSKIDRQMIYVEIMSIADKISNLNLRSLIFACQKTVDILRIYDRKIDKTFVKYLFMSVVAFSFRLKTNDKLCWSEKETGRSLGASKYPLPKFAHDYVKYQILDAKEIEKEEQAFLAQKKAEAEQNAASVYLSILYEFYSKTSALLEGAVVEIKRYLEETNVINVIIYGKLANYLIIARSLIDTPSLIDECKEIMKTNLQNGDYDGNKVSDSLTFHDTFKLWTPEQEEEYNEFIADMQSAVKNRRNSKLNFDYTVESIDALVKDSLDNESDYLNQRTFLKRFDIDKLLQVIKQCTSKQIDDLRRPFGTIYSSSNINEFYMDDKPSLLQLKDGLVTLLLSEEAGDKIKRMQLSWFIDRLERILEKLN